MLPAIIGTRSAFDFLPARSSDAFQPLAEISGGESGELLLPSRTDSLGLPRNWSLPGRSLLS